MAIEKVRLNIQIEKVLKSWCERKSDELGISMNALINIILVSSMQSDELQQDKIRL